MLDLETPRTIRADSAGAAIPAAGSPIAPARQPLSQAAQSLAAQTVATAWSPIVLAGFVRMIEFALTVLVGVAIYGAYVVPIDGFQWHYGAAIFGIATLALLAFQVADIYQVQAFRGYEKQYFRLASAWSVVFLLVIGATFFAKAGDQFSRVWLGTYYAVGLAVLIGFRRALFLFVRHWTREGRLDRRTVVVGGDERGEALVTSLASQRRQRRPRHRRVRRPQRRPLARTSSPAGAKLGSVDDLVEFARTTRVDLVIVSLPITAENRVLQMLQASCGCCRSTSGSPRT